MSNESPKNKIDVFINVYDLLAPGKLSSFLWTIGNGLLHSGVQIEDREYAYGGHAKPGVSGVYWTRPLMEPPGATFRCQMKQGSTSKSQDEIHDIIVEASQRFLGPSWNLLSNNCNDFTMYICQLLTGKPAPTWLNRAASVALAMPCIVPSVWLTPPDAATSNGELLKRDEDLAERTALLEDAQLPSTNGDDDNDYSTDGSDSANSFIARFDSSGSTLPVSERAPIPI